MLNAARRCVRASYRAIPHPVAAQKTSPSGEAATEKTRLPGRTALFVPRIEAVDAVAARVDAVDAVVGGHPDDTRRLFDDVADHVVRDRVRIVGFELVGAEPRAVVNVQPVPRAEPHELRGVLVDAGHRTVRQTVVVGERAAADRCAGERRSRERRAQKQDKKLFRHTHGLVRTKIGLFPEPHPGIRRGKIRNRPEKTRIAAEPCPPRSCAAREWDAPGAHEEPGGADRAARTPGKDGQ